MLIVGQELWFSPEDRRGGAKGYPVRVIQVGRKWAKLDGSGRVNMETMWIDGEGYSSPGRCWLSQEAWLAEEARQKAWSDLRKIVDRKYQAPDDISEQNIKSAIGLIATPT